MTGGAGDSGRTSATGSLYNGRPLRALTDLTLRRVDRHDFAGPQLLRPRRVPTTHGIPSSRETIAA